MVIFFGLNFLGVFNVTLFCGSKRAVNTDNMGFFSAVLFGIVFSIGWTPCVGAFLGSALMPASQQDHVAEGLLMLLAYSLGLGIPFILSAVLIGYLKSTFDWIKTHYRIINLISGGLLILIGLLIRPLERGGQQATESDSGENSEDQSKKVSTPDFTIYDRDNNEVHLSDFVGKPVVLNFWANWCSPC